MNIARTSCPADSARSPVWVVGSFSLTEAPLARHAAAVLAGLLAEQVDACAVTMRAGAFGEWDLSAGLNRGDPVEYAVVYLRPVLAQYRPSRARSVFRSVFDTLRLARRADRLVVVRDPSGSAAFRAAQMGLAIALRLCGAKILSPLACPAETVRLLTGRQPPLQSRRVIRRLVFSHIRSRAPDAVLRLSDRHIDDALEALSKNWPAVAAQLSRLKKRSVPIDADDVRAAGLARAAAADPPRALAAAARPIGVGDITALARHLKQLGKPRRTWRRVCQDRIARTLVQPGTKGALLRHLVGRVRGNDREMLGFLDEATGIPGLTALDWILICGLRLRINSPTDLERPWSAQGLRDQLRQLLPPPVVDQPAPRLAVAGLLGQETGLARNLAMTSRAIERLGVPARRIGVDLTGGVDGSRPNEATRFTVSRDAVIWHLNADRIPQEMANRPGLQDALHIGFLLWELDRIPRVHRLALRMLDEIWAPTRFVADIYAAQAKIPVRVMKKAILVPRPVSWPRPAAGVARFLTCLDFHSSVARKNPLAAVRAFQIAFPRRDDVELLIKTTDHRTDHWGDPEGQAARIAAIAAADHRIKIIEAFLPLDALCGLIASADALVTPHRAEGFGYFPAFAMSLGVPVIATDYSGTTDFCTAATSFPVPAALVPVPQGHSIFPVPGARWAEIDVDALAATMSLVVSDPAAAAERAAAALQLMHQTYSVDAQAERYQRRLTELGVIAPVGPNGCTQQSSNDDLHQAA